MNRACVDGGKRGLDSSSNSDAISWSLTRLVAISPPVPKNTKPFAQFQFSITFRPSRISRGKTTSLGFSQREIVCRCWMNTPLAPEQTLVVAVI